MQNQIYTFNFIYPISSFRFLFTFYINLIFFSQSLPIFSFFLTSPPLPFLYSLNNLPLLFISQYNTHPYINGDNKHLLFYIQHRNHTLRPSSSDQSQPSIKIIIIKFKIIIKMEITMEEDNEREKKDGNIRV